MTCKCPAGSDLETCFCMYDDLARTQLVPVDDRDRWIRLFNRLQGAVQHHRDADRFKDEHDEALYAAMDRVLKDAAA